MPVPHVSTMDIMNSHPALDAYNRIPNVASTLPVVEKTASYTCKVEESGTHFIANHASTAVNFTLPTLATAIAGVWYEFFNVGAAGMVITTDPADKLVVDNDAAADTLTWSTATHIIGGSAKVFTDGALWYAQIYNYASTATAAS